MYSMFHPDIADNSVKYERIMLKYVNTNLTFVKNIRNIDFKLETYYKKKQFSSVLRDIVINSAGNTISINKWVRVVVTRNEQ